MLRYVLKTIHVVLLLSAFYYVYRTASPLVASSPVPEVPIPELTIPEVGEISLARYQTITSRNLFQSQAEVPEAEAPAPEEELAESQLQLRLLGTIAASEIRYSIATLEDEATREHLHVRVGDPIGESTDVVVARIEPRQIVIRNRGKLEALKMDEELHRTRPKRSQPSAKRGPPNRRARPLRPTAAARAGSKQEGLLRRVRNLSRRPGARTGAAATGPRGEDLGLALKQLDEAAEKSASRIQNLLAQVQLAPSIGADGQQTGMKVTRVTPGSALARSGLEAGEIIVSVNGVAVSGPADLPKLLPALEGAGAESCLETLTPGGARATRCWSH
ncbi:MAG: type II secretion system protein N [Myxococcota bacterium]